MKKKVRVAIFHFAFVYSGGGERLVLEQAIRLANLGYEVTCFAPIIDRERCFPELMDQISVRRLLPKILPDWFPEAAVFSILAVCVLVPFFGYRFSDYDIYFGANQPGTWIGYVLSKINRKPYVSYLAQPTRLVHPRLIDQKTGLRITGGVAMLSLLTSLFKPLISFLDLLSIAHSTVVFVNGSYMSGVMAGVYGVNPVNCPAGAEIKRSKIKDPHYAEASRDRQRSKIKKIRDLRFRGFITLRDQQIRKPYVLVTNRHFAQKRFEYAIEAVAGLKRRVALVITGEETGYTRMLRRKYAKYDFVYFVGLLSEQQLEEVYRQAVVYVYPAPEEDFGMGIVEAMARGVPVVAWGNAGPTGIISHGVDGLLARPFVVEDFALQIQRVLDDEKFYTKIASASIRTVKYGFSYERHVEILDRHIRKLLGIRTIVDNG